MGQYAYYDPVNKFIIVMLIAKPLYHNFMRIYTHLRYMRQFIRASFPFYPIFASNISWKQRSSSLLCPVNYETDDGANLKNKSRNTVLYQCWKLQKIFKVQWL